MALSPEPNRLHRGHLPTPFSAEDIRAASTVGRRIRIRTDARDGSSYREVRYLATDADGATQAFTPTDADGHPIGPTVERRSAWRDLQAHASFPADRTTVEETHLDLAWGTESCWLYRVAEGETVTRYWFARRLPGMPVVVESRVGGELVERREIISTSAAPSV
jgi:hypothetical protein